ncbi:MAG: hypothetical protein HZB38_06230 [Planctomycetes bacterium]|nr:hypothetical protein [Planctomycetota bacterium]
MRPLFAMLTVLGLATAAIAQTSNAPAAGRTLPGQRNTGTLAQLNKRIPEVSFEGLPLDQVIDWLQGYTGMNVNVHWQTLTDAGVARDKGITIKVKNLRLSQVLWMIMNEAGGPDIKLAYRASGNLLILSTEDELGKEMLVRVYEVGDLLLRIRDFYGAPQIDLQNQQSTGGQGGGGGGSNIFGGGGGSGGQDDDQQDRGNQEQAGVLDPEMGGLITLIQQTVQPDTWEVNGGLGTITAWRTQLVVRNNIRVHQELAGPVSDGE